MLLLVHGWSVAGKGSVLLGSSSSSARRLSRLCFHAPTARTAMPTSDSELPMPYIACPPNRAYKAPPNMAPTHAPRPFWTAERSPCAVAPSSENTNFSNTVKREKYSVIIRRHLCARARERESSYVCTNAAYNHSCTPAPTQAHGSQRMYTSNTMWLQVAPLTRWHHFVHVARRRSKAQCVREPMQQLNGECPGGVSQLAVQQEPDAVRQQG